MEPLFFVMAIIGCGDGGTGCTDARVLPARYATAAQCQAALPRMLADNTDVPFPEIEANCRARRVEVAKADARVRRGS